MSYDYLLLDKGARVPLYQQLYDQLCAATASGSLRPGQKLPSIRALSEDLSLSRTTVEAAYQQLCVEGYLEAKPQRGYFVLAAEKRAVPRPILREKTAAAPKPRYNFGTEAVDGGCADLKAWRRHVRDVLTREEVLVRYGDHQGEPSLRAALREYTFGARGVLCGAEQIVVAAGTQPLLYLLCGLLQGEAGAVAMEQPGFLQAEQVFSDCGLTVVKLSSDEHGPRLSSLWESGAKVLYVTPSSRPGDGGPIPLLRRQELLAWARETGGLLIEDDYNGELRYRARPIPAMQGMEDGGRVLYLGSFSKLLLPSVRVGYMVLPQTLLSLYGERARRYNQTASRVEQLALADYIRDGQLERHLRRLRKVYAQKSETLLKALETAFGPRASCVLQETPLTVRLHLAGAPAAPRLTELAAAHGVRVMPARDGGLLLGFAGIPQTDIPPAVAALREAFAGVL